MTPDKKLSEIFGQFAGREVDAKEVTTVLKSKRLGDMTLTHVEVNANDPALRELEQLAVKKGYEVRVWSAGMAGTCDWVENRVNVDVTKEADGKFRIQPSFRIG